MKKGELESEKKKNDAKKQQQDIKKRIRFRKSTQKGAGAQQFSMESLTKNQTCSK